MSQNPETNFRGSTAPRPPSGPTPPPTSSSLPPRRLSVDLNLPLAEPGTGPWEAAARGDADTPGAAAWDPPPRPGSFGRKKHAGKTPKPHTKRNPRAPAAPGVFVDLESRGHHLRRRPEVEPAHRQGGRASNRATTERPWSSTPPPRPGSEDTPGCWRPWAVACSWSSATRSSPRSSATACSARRRPARRCSNGCTWCRAILYHLPPPGGAAGPEGACPTKRQTCAAAAGGVSDVRTWFTWTRCSPRSRAAPLPSASPFPPLLRRLVGDDLDAWAGWWRWRCASRGSAWSSSTPHCTPRPWAASPPPRTRARRRYGMTFTRSRECSYCLAARVDVNGRVR